MICAALGGPLTEKQTQTQQAIKRNANRLLALVNDLLDCRNSKAQGVTLAAGTGGA